MALIRETLTEIFSFVGAEDLTNLSLVCKQWNEIAQHNYIWRNVFEQNYPKLVSFFEKLLHYKNKPRGNLFYLPF